MSRVSALDVMALIVAAGDCREMQYTESGDCKFDYGVEYKIMRVYHHTDVFSKDNRVCEIPPRRCVAFQSRHLLSEIGNQFMQNLIAYLPYQLLYSSPLGPLQPKKHYKGHKLDDPFHH